MYKKMLSTIIAALVVFGAVAVMPAMADVDEVGTVYLRDDFENYTVGTTYGGGEHMTDDDGNYTLYGGSCVGGEVVSVTGYDGETTTAMKAYLVEEGSSEKDTNRLKFHLTVERPQSGIAVTEMKIFFPEENRISAFTSDTLRAGDGGGNRLAYGRDANKEAQTIGYYSKEVWTKIKFVHDIDTGKTITYVDDVMTTYHKYEGIITRDAETGTVKSGIYPGSYFARFSGKDNYILVDDINWYYAPAATAVSETFPANGAEGAKFATEPSVTFTHPLMNVVGEVATGEDVAAPETVVTPENVTVKVIECADESKLGEVEIEEVTLSNENKTLNIKPAADFPGSAEIQVTVSGLKDDMDRDVEDVVYTFTTMEAVNLTGTPVFKKENLVFANGTVLSALENGYISCNYELTNESTTADVDVLYFAVLKVNGAVESFQFMPATILKNGGKAAFNGGFTVKDAENSAIEVYVWDGFRNMASLVPVVIFE